MVLPGFKARRSASSLKCSLSYYLHGVVFNCFRQMEKYLGVRVGGSCSVCSCPYVAGRLRLLLPAWGILYPTTVGKLHNCWEESFQNRLWTIKDHEDKTLKKGGFVMAAFLETHWRYLTILFLGTPRTFSARQSWKMSFSVALHESWCSLIFNP